MSLSAFVLFVFTVPQGLVLGSKNSEELPATEGAAQGSVCSPGDVTTSGRTAMDTIIAVNDRQGVYTVEGVRIREGDVAVSKHSGRSCFAQTCLWSKSVDGHVYIAYVISPLYSPEHQNSILQGMQLIERGTCVRFVPKTHQSDYLDIQSQSGCWSYLGASGGRQVLSLQAPDCVDSAVVSHQLMHALGFLHEQSRADRDKYVTILWSNIMRDRKSNFERFRTSNLKVPYDYGSIMHFGKYAYSDDGKPTIIPKRNQNVQLGQTFGPSKLDTVKINKLYNCNMKEIDVLETSY